MISRKALRPGPGWKTYNAIRIYSHVSGLRVSFSGVVYLPDDHRPWFPLMRQRYRDALHFFCRANDTKPGDPRYHRALMAWAKWVGKELKGKWSNGLS